MTYQIVCKYTGMRLKAGLKLGEARRYCIAHNACFFTPEAK